MSCSKPGIWYWTYYWIHVEASLRLLQDRKETNLKVKSRNMPLLHNISCSFWIVLKIAQSTAILVSCSVKNCKWIGQGMNKLWFELLLTLEGYPIVQQSPERCLFRENSRKLIQPSRITLIYSTTIPISALSSANKGIDPTRQLTAQLSLSSKI